MKKSAIQIALEKIEAEIAELGRVRDRLEAVAKEPKAKRERKPKPVRVESTRSLSETH